MHDFTLTRKDFAALVQQLNANVTPRDSVLSFAFALRVALWAALGHGFYGYFKAYDMHTVANHHLLNAGVGALVALVLGAATYVFNAKRVASRLLSGNGWFLAPQAMRIDEVGIEHRSRLGQTQFLWHAFIKHTEDQDRFFLFVEPGQGFVVPKTILQDVGLQELIRARVPK